MYRKKARISGWRGCILMGRALFGCFTGRPERCNNRYGSIIPNVSEGCFANIIEDRNHFRLVDVYVKHSLKNGFSGSDARHFSLRLELGR